MGSGAPLPALRVSLSSQQPKNSKIQECPTHLHHEDDGVESDHDHDKILKGRGHHEFPHLVLEGLLVLRHVAGQGLGTYGKVYAGPLQNKKGMKRCQKKKGLEVFIHRDVAGRVSRAFTPSER